MSRLHGRNGIVYLGVLNGAAASPLSFQSDYSMNFVVAKVDVTAMGDPNLIYAPGLPDASGDFTGWYDDATSQTYIAAADGLARNFYLYPTKLNPLQYFFGQIFPDFATAGGVAAGVTAKSTWNAASAIQRYGVGGLGT
ncbi:MAG: hypothetical protein M3Y33_03855 [Actinomycetota bacterium]|nr:hypothetical protein [Actinomycetota bacterium]